jgi:hypothetical protein
MNLFKFKRSLIRHALCLISHFEYSLKLPLKGRIKSSEMYTHVLDEKFRQIKTHEIINHKMKSYLNTQLIVGTYTPFYSEIKTSAFTTS